MIKDLIFIREGVVIWPNAATLFDNGVIEMTKNISHDESPAFVHSVLEAIRFPCVVRVDAHGFIGEKSGKVIGFQFASLASSLTLHNGKSHAPLDGGENTDALLNHFKGMNGEEFLSKWFEAHDRVAELAASGFTANNTKTVVIYLEPIHMTASDIFSVKFAGRK